MCSICGVTNSSENLLDIFSEEEYDTILSGIFYGLITKSNLNYNYYFKTAEKLTDGIYFGFGETIQSSAINSKNYNMHFLGVSCIQLEVPYQIHPAQKIKRLQLVQQLCLLILQLFLQLVLQKK